MSERELRLVMLGRQGSGKGTQAVRLAEHYSIVHLSTGDMFRSQAAQGTAFGLEARRYMDAGELVPDEIVIGVIEECLAPGGLLGDGFVLDGFPRTLLQAEELDRVLGERPLSVALDLEVPEAVVLSRLAGRRVCEKCQRVYHVDLPPGRDWTCDDCGGPVTQRPDDTEVAIRRRLDIYNRDTTPIVGYYRERGCLVSVDGTGTSDEVFARVRGAIDGHRGGAG